MTLHGVKAEVGIRELHDQLSRYVQHVSEGGEVLVTMRGRPVARLAPIRDDDPLTELRARGLVREATQPRRKLSGTAGTQASGLVSDLVAEQRR